MTDDTLSAIAAALERAAGHLEEAAAVISTDARTVGELVHRLALEHAGALEPGALEPERDRCGCGHPRADHGQAGTGCVCCASTPAPGYPWRIGRG